jgi:hypothetical protein
VRREQQAALVADYLARGGEIHHIPPPKPTVASDVLNFLQSMHVDVHSVSDAGGDANHYRHKGKRISLKELVELANRRRRKRKLPPFQLDNYSH